MIRGLSILLAIGLLGSHIPIQATSETRSDGSCFAIMEESVWEAVHEDLSRLSCDSISEVERHGGRILLTVAVDDLGVLASVVQERVNPRVGFVVYREWDEAFGALHGSTVGAELKRAVDYGIDRANIVNAVFSNLTESEIIETIVTLSDFNNRYYLSQTGVDAAHWLRDLWLSMSEHRDDVQVSLFDHNVFPQPSVIATMRGYEMPEEVVVIGGHLDSIISDMTIASRAPGADDNASGIATLTEVFRALLQIDYTPGRSLSFMGYAAEEVGLLGSKDVADAYARDGIQVVGMLNLDMTNYNGSVEDIIIINDFSDTDQNVFLGDLADTYLDVVWVDVPCGYACSDHSTWTEAGYPASMLFEARFQEINPYIHGPADLIDVSDGRAEHAMKFAQLAAAYAVEMTDGSLGQVAAPQRWVVHVTAENGGFFSSILMANLSDQSARMVLDGYASSGSPIGQVIQDVAPNSLMSMDARAAWAGANISHFSVNGPDSCLVTVAYRGNTQGNASVHVAETRGSGTEFRVYTGEWDLVFDGLAMVNLGTEAMRVTGTQWTPAGDRLEDFTVFKRLTPFEKGLMVFEEVFQDLPGSLITIETDQPSAAVFLRGTRPGVSPGYLFENVAVVE